MRCRFISALSTICLVLSLAWTASGQFSRYPSNSPGPSQIQEYPQTAAAGPDGSQPALNDPEDRQHGVARVSVAQGDVNVKRGDNGQLDAAVVNAPLMAQDHLQTAVGSRAEIELDAANFIRLGPNTDVGLADLQYRRYQAQLGLGSIVLRVLSNTGAQLEVDTPSVALRPLEPGVYRISVLEDGTSQVTVRSGRLEMSGPAGSQSVQAGQTLLVRGDASNPEYQSGYEITRDQLDDWSAARDNEVLSSQSYNYVSPDIGGAQDLDANGSWVPSEYGQVWAPHTVAADWSPYSDGHWVYENYYGWTWIDNASWGWAPYHYGRWFMNGSRWCWWPGVRGGGHYWSPALVGFFGIRGGGLGWAALAPFEFGFSWWGRGAGRGGFGYGGYGFGRGGPALYRNAGYRGGAITASFGAFGGPNQRFRAASPGQLAGATIYRGQIPVSPGQSAYRFSGRAAVANPRLPVNRQFFNSRGSNARGPNGGFVRVAPNPNGTTRGVAPAGGGWQRFGSPNSTGAVREGGSMREGFAASGTRGDQNGWHSFGQPQSGSQAYRGSTPNYSQPNRQQPNQRPAYGGGGYSGYNNRSGESQRYRPAPSQSYIAPQQRYSAPAQQHYNAPQRSSSPAQPHYSAPQSHGGGHSGGGGAGGASRGGGGGGGGHRGR